MQVLSMPFPHLNLNIFYVHWYEDVRSLELELQTVVSCHVSAGN